VLLQGSGITLSLLQNALHNGVLKNGHDLEGNTVSILEAE
jgi:hypothetical protein